MDPTNKTIAELLQDCYQNPPQSDTAIWAVTELQRRRDEKQLRYNRLLTVFTGLLAFFTALLAYETTAKIVGQLVS